MQIEIMLITSNGRPQVRDRYSSARQKIKTRIDRWIPGGLAALHHKFL
ncbi:MAG TPA: hypothetical protein VHH88_12610 [Verrucomicrobiae bacterium]|nr:hypothetical protein [Verrucomicrobiae bacterium]